MTNSFNMSDWRRKYVLMAENDNQYPDYNPDKHKTLMRGAIDYELEGDNIVAYLPFEEEPEYAVKMTFPVSRLEQYLGDEIEDNEALQAYDSYRIDSFFHNKWTGLFGKYYIMAKDRPEDPFLKGKFNETTEMDLMEQVSGEEDLDFFMDKIIGLAQKAKDTWSKDDRMNYFRVIEQAVRDAEFFIKTLPRY